MALYGGRLYTSKFLVWLEVFARGLVVRELAGAVTRRYRAAIDDAKVSVHFTTRFSENHPLLVHRVRHFAKLRKRSKWTCEEDKNKKNCRVIDNREDFRQFLLSIQRVPQNSLGFAERFRLPPRD